MGVDSFLPLPTNLPRTRLGVSREKTIMTKIVRCSFTWNKNCGKSQTMSRARKVKTHPSQSTLNSTLFNSQTLKVLAAIKES